MQNISTSAVPAPVHHSTALSSLPASTQLRAALTETVEPVYGDDGGYREQRVWTTPATISADLREDARRQLTALEPLMRPVGADALRQWLIALGIATAGAKKSAEEVRAKLGMYLLALGDVPAGAVTKDTLAKAAKSFQWWPSVAELGRFLDGEAVPMKIRAGRLRAIINGKDKPEEGDPWDGPRTLGEVAQAAVDRLRADTPGWQPRPQQMELLDRGYLKRARESLAGFRLED